MSKKARQLPLNEKWTAVNRQLKNDFPHIYALLANSDEFRELRIKSRDDGTLLGILKAYGPDGGPIVAFGTGYDAAAVLMSLDGSVNGDNWKYDKPWKPGKE